MHGPARPAPSATAETTRQPRTHHRPRRNRDGVIARGFLPERPPLPVPPSITRPAFGPGAETECSPSGTGAPHRFDIVWISSGTGVLRSIIASTTRRMALASL